ncbi:DUF1523 family protein [Paragemmobacter straminiformis]|uniref:DUF1523 family protein n=1 Tax=Paragemmobacter straminiformis TaxID=2045119 RepID=A0A842I9Q3_9RHOB|nr:DUF1523 family protein [Gemmobacter straminiformis]MBC2836321.1 DUF1523 family protein [Gemmobacter straminiformis]
MRYVKWSLLGLIGLFLLTFLHYTLPQHDIVRIVGTENRRMEIGENSWFFAAPDVGTASSTSRDIFFINSVYPDGKTMEFRNEDTGWGWPPYFKMNSFSLATEAKELVSTKDKPIWVSVTHYGWRNQLFTIFPNAVGLKQVDGPDVTIIPWVNIVILGFALVLAVLVRRMWRQFRERMIEPAVIDVQQSIDDLEERGGRAGERARGFFGRLFGRK